MEFKVGDRVQVVATHNAFCGDKGNVIANDGTDILPIKVSFDDGEHECWFYEDDLKVLHEEETRMKFKVGDKVKVSDSWFGNDGQVGVIERTDHMEPYNYSVKFDVEGDNERYDENFRGDSLELVKQSFTKSDLKTGMGVVLRDGDKGHVLLDTEAGDVIRLIDGDNHQWMSTKDYDSEMCDSDMDRLDIMEVYSSHLAYCYVTERLFDSKNLVFKREEPKPEPIKMTMKEINEYFGKAIEIVE